MDSRTATIFRRLGMIDRLIRIAKRIAALSFAMSLILASCRGAPEPPTGQALYLRHCASCHGESGDGNGSLAASLRQPPSDLRLIAKRHGGRFDESYVMQIIDGRRPVAEHGTREMPVWGAVFESEHRPEGYPTYTSLLHSRALTDYLGSIQQK
jgi:mono/diheme cytochrome c family protein